jgi:hypothetical protein
MISINIDKAKNIAHNIRREKREEEFAPYDSVIMKQIPGNDLTAAEAARAEIRTKYETIQTEINDASTPEELKTILESLE